MPPPFHLPDVSMFNLTKFTKSVMNTIKERLGVFLIDNSTKTFLSLFGLVALAVMMLVSGAVDAATAEACTVGIEGTCTDAGCVGGPDNCYAPPEGGMCYTTTEEVIKQ